MYKGGLGGGAAAVTTGATLLLPNTGGNLIVNLALSVGAGLAVWGLVYNWTH